MITIRMVLAALAGVSVVLGTSMTLRAAEGNNVNCGGTWFQQWYDDDDDGVPDPGQTEGHVTCKGSCDPSAITCAEETGPIEVYGGSTTYTKDCACDGDFTPGGPTTSGCNLSITHWHPLPGTNPPRDGWTFNCATAGCANPCTGSGGSGPPIGQFGICNCP